MLLYTIYYPTRGMDSDRPLPSASDYPGAIAQCVNGETEYLHSRRGKWVAVTRDEADAIRDSWKKSSQPVARVNVNLSPDLRDWAAAQPGGITGTITEALEKLRAEGRTQEVLDELNGYEGADIWEDVIRMLPDLDDETTERAYAVDDAAFVLNNGAHIECSAGGKWFEREGKTLREERTEREGQMDRKGE